MPVRTWTDARSIAAATSRARYISISTTSPTGRIRCPTAAVRPEDADFTATFNPALVRTLDDMRANLATGAEQVIDARGPAKFDGTQEDVFPAKKLGHMPNAVNIPWGDLIHPETGAIIGPSALGTRFAAAGIDLGRPIVATCASSILSCVVALGLHVLGHKATAVYDGSWAEWGIAEDTPAVASMAAA